MDHIQFYLNDVSRLLAGVPVATIRGVVDRLLRRVHAQGIRVSCLLLDKGFESIAMMAYLTRQGQAALIACPIRGTTGGTRALCQGRKSYVTAYTFKDKHGQAFTTPVLVCRVFTTARRTGRLHRQADWLLFVELGLTLSPRYARQLYGHRFGIDVRAARPRAKRREHSGQRDNHGHCLARRHSHPPASLATDASWP